MNRNRWLASIVLGLSLLLYPGFASAQAPAEPPAAEGEGQGSGRPLDGYFATLALSGLVLFIVGKSARRS